MVVYIGRRETCVSVIGGTFHTLRFLIFGHTGNEKFFPPSPESFERRIVPAAFGHRNNDTRAEKTPHKANDVRIYINW